MKTIEDNMFTITKKFYPEVLNKTRVEVIDILSYNYIILYSLINIKIIPTIN